MVTLSGMRLFCKSVCSQYFVCIFSYFLTLMQRAMQANSPRYLAESVTAFVPYRSLLSALVMPVINMERFGRRAFSCTGHSLWNSLLLHLRSHRVSGHFRKDLNTFLFKPAFA